LQTAKLCCSHTLSHVDALSHVNTWVFDLDNTLYPADCDLWPKIDQRITLYLSHLFGLDGMSSRALQKYYYQRYGTTLRGLMEEHGIGPEEFLDFTHDIERSSNTGDARASGDLPDTRMYDAERLRQSRDGLDCWRQGGFDRRAKWAASRRVGSRRKRTFRRSPIFPANGAILSMVVVRREVSCSIWIRA
jgi:hypothetical protein